ncbi:MAG: hypothetical protein ACTHMP_11510 [Thermomicrobiales bacterium]
MSDLAVAMVVWLVPATVLGLLAALASMRYLRLYQTQYTGTAASPPTIYQRQPDVRLERLRRWMYGLWFSQAIWLFAGFVIVMKFFFTP